MADHKKSLLSAKATFNSNADNVSSGLSTGLMARPFKIDEYQDDKDSTDPLDLLGNYILPNEILVPSDASQNEKFDYYHAILNSVGQELSGKPGSTHILALRGVVKDKKGNIIQTSSATKYQLALHGVGKLENQQHFSDSQSARQSPGRLHDTAESTGTWNDMIIILAIDENSKKSVTENVGSVDPAKTGDSWGSAHLMDGTFDYGIGSHGTKIENHKEEIIKLTEDEDYMKVFRQWKEMGKERYNAMVPVNDLKVMRDGVKKVPKQNYENQPESKGFFSDKDIEIYKRNKQNKKKYTSHKSIATNGHIGGTDESFSEGCWNLPLQSFINMMLLMKKQQKLSGKKANDFIVKFTLLDASKVGFKLIKSIDKGTDVQKRTDFSEYLDFISNLIKE